MENIVQFHYTETIHAVMEGGREGGRKEEGGWRMEGRKKEERGESEEVKRRVKDLYI